jgi:hypothetical protein
MRFSIEQVFLTDSAGKPLGERPAAARHIVEADTLDIALSAFIGDQQATLVGSIQRFPGAQAVATAQQQGTVFTLHVVPATDPLPREGRLATADGADAASESARPR